MAKKYEIRNSTAEFLTFVAEGKEQGIQVLYKNETVWAAQKAMTQLFDCSTDNIGLHPLLVHFITSAFRSPIFLQCAIKCIPLRGSL